MLRLPSELVSAIATQTAHIDLLACRLVSRTFASYSQDAFAARFLRHLARMYTDVGLQGLVNICAHEVFRPYVQSVELTVYRPCIADKEDWLSLVKPHPHLSDDVAEAEKWAIILNVEAECAELFATALRNFSSAGVIPVLSFQSYPHCSDGNRNYPGMIGNDPYGGKQQYDIATSLELDWQLVSDDRDEQRSCLELRLDGVVRAQYPVQDLQLGSSTRYFWWWKNPFACISLPRPDFRTPMSVFAAPFANLQTLTVAVNPKTELETDPG